MQEGVRRREQFLAMLSHELRNPLAAILSATHLMTHARSSEDICQEAGRVVARQAQHMSRLLDDLLDVSRITRGRIVLHKEPIDLRDTARSAIEALGPLMAERDIAARRGDRRTSRFRWSATRRACSRFRRIC